MQTFILQKIDGTKYRVKGKALTPVFHDEHGFSPYSNSVIELASGEKVLYIWSRPEYRHANRHVSVQMLYRNAETLTTTQIADLTGTDQNKRIFEALGKAEFEEIY